MLLSNRPTFNHTPIDLGYTDIEAVTLPTGRTYLAPDGNKYPSVTTVLGVLNRDSIAQWRAKVGEAEANRVSNKASKRGTAVHELIEVYLNNEDIGNPPLHILASLNNLRPILDNRIGDILVQEAPLFSNHLGIAGRVDCIAMFDGVLSIIDFKTSKKPKRREWLSNYFIQESCYAIMWEERTGQPITQLVTIMDVDGAEPAVYIEHRDDWTKELIETIALYKERL